MTKGLFDIEGQQQQPATEREAMATLAAEEEDRAADMKQAREDVERITQQIIEGDAPEIILYRAIRCIGCLIHDTDWAETCQGMLDQIYDDLMQQNLEADAAAEGRARLEARAKEASEKTRKQLERRIRDHTRLVEDLTKALSTLNGIEPQQSDN